MKRLGIVLLAASAICPRMTYAGTTPCPPERSLYAYDWGDEDGTRTVFMHQVVPPTELPPRATDIRFETWRKGKLIWSVDGEIYCSDVVPMCNLKLESTNDTSPNEEHEQCAAFPLAVEQIREGEQIACTVFGALTAYSMGCGKYAAIRVQDKGNLSAFERTEKIFPLPSYVRFESCKD